jgi:hypothetical protein
MDLSTYKLNVDENVKPDWLTDSMLENAERKLHQIVKKRIITEDRKLLIGGIYVIAEGVKIGTVKDAFVEVINNATINNVMGNATINDVRDNATINDVRGNATINTVRDNATINDVRDNATINDVRDNATINIVRGNATINDVWDNATIKNDKRVNK